MSDNIVIIIENGKLLKMHVSALKEDLNIQGLSSSGLNKYLQT